MTLEERAMQVYGTPFDLMDKMTQESIRKDCVQFAAADMFEALKTVLELADETHWRCDGEMQRKGTCYGIYCAPEIFERIDAAIKKAEGRA